MELDYPCSACLVCLLVLFLSSPVSKSENAKGERTFRFHQMDSGQATDNGLTTATALNGDVGSRFRSGRVTDTGTEHSDSTSFRNSRPSNNRRRKNHLQPSRGGGGGGKPSSPPRQKSLPPPAPRTGKPGTYQDWFF